MWKLSINAPEDYKKYAELLKNLKQEQEQTYCSKCSKNPLKYAISYKQFG